MQGSARGAAPYHRHYGLLLPMTSNPSPITAVPLPVTRHPECIGVRRSYPLSWGPSPLVPIPLPVAWGPDIYRGGCHGGLLHTEWGRLRWWVLLSNLHCSAINGEHKRVQRY